MNNLLYRLLSTWWGPVGRSETTFTNTSDIIAWPMVTNDSVTPGIWSIVSVTMAQMVFSNPLRCFVLLCHDVTITSPCGQVRFEEWQRHLRLCSHPWQTGFCHTAVSYNFYSLTFPCLWLDPDNLDVIMWKTWIRVSVTMSVSTVEPTALCCLNCQVTAPTLPQICWPRPVPRDRRWWFNHHTLVKLCKFATFDLVISSIDLVQSTQIPIRLLTNRMASRSPTRACLHL